MRNHMKDIPATRHGTYEKMTSTYPSKRVTHEARSIFVECKAAAKAQGLKAFYVGHAIRVGGPDTLLVVYYRVDGIEQESTMAL